MGKDESEIVRLAGRHVFELFRNSNPGSPLIYYGYKRSREVVGVTKEIAKGNKLNGDDGQVLLLAAWFHDAGYAGGENGGLAKSIEHARTFLAQQGQPQRIGDAVAACLQGVDGEDLHDGLVQDVLRDALLVSIASKNYPQEAELLRLDEERLTGKVYSDVEWTRSRIDYLQNHAFRTRWAQLEYNGQRARNLVRLHKLLRRQTEDLAAGGAKIASRPARTTDRLFGELTRNQLKLLSIADRRTSTMIHVNAIMISVLVALVLRRIEDHRNLLVPTVVFLCVNLTVVVLSIWSLRAGRGLIKEFEREDIPAHDANLLITTNEADLSLPEYVHRVNQLVADAPALQNAMIEYLYFGRRMIILRRRALALTYNVFLFGLAIGLISFVVAMARQ